jgi:hypothetical protein
MHLSLSCVSLCVGIISYAVGINQGVQYPLAGAYAAAEGAYLMVKKAAALIDANRDAEKESHIAKLLASKASWQVRGINAHKGGIHITGFMLSKAVVPPPPLLFSFLLGSPETETGSLTHAGSRSLYACLRRLWFCYRV